MIVKIKPSAGAMSMAILYNERKVTAGEAKALCRMNMDGNTAEATRETFARYERLNIRSREVSFHMSINPGQGESLPDEKVVEFASAMLKELGYEGQPFVVYRHNDIEREHYHVLSIRIKTNGRKIPSFQEQRTCQRALKTLAPVYGFHIGNHDTENATGHEISSRCFDISLGNVSSQMDAVIRECLKYHFTTTQQFVWVMNDHNLNVKFKGRQMFVQGLNSDGKKCTAPLGKSEYIVPVLDRMQESISEDKSKAAHRVAQIGTTLLPYSKSERHYVNMMLKKGIHVLPERDKHGVISKVTYIDHEGRNVFTSGDMGHELSLSMIQDADKNQWEHYDHNNSSHLDIGGILFGTNGDSRGHERDPKQKKKKSLNQHI